MKHLVPLTCAALACLPVAAQPAPALADTYRAMQDQMARSPFGEPVVLKSGDAAERPRGDVYALLQQPFETVREAFRRGDTWCQVLLLQSNIKACVPTAGKLKVGVVRKSEQPASEAQAVEFDFVVQEDAGNRLVAELKAPEGPVGTRDYRIGLEAVPVDGQRSFLHLSYAYATGAMARVATNAYLASAGRDKVGFTVTGRGTDGQPQYVGGIRGIAERNTMRYYFAIEAVLESLQAAPASQLERQLRGWISRIEKHPRQLREMAPDAYLASKRRERQGAGPG